MIEFTLYDGNPVIINPTAIEYFQPADDATLISFTGGNSVTVSEPYSTVLAALIPPSELARQGAERW